MTRDNADILCNNCRILVGGHMGSDRSPNRDLVTQSALLSVYVHDRHDYTYTVALPGIH